MFTYVSTYAPRCVLVALACLVLLAPLSTQAQTVVRSGDTVGVDSDQTIDGNFYSAANAVNVSGIVNGDWMAIGESVTGNGSFSDDVAILARTANLYGSTTEDVRMIALEATVAEYVGGNLVVVADSVQVLSTADIAGDILLFANEAEINGSVGGNILGTVGELRIDGVVAGMVDVTTNSLTLGRRANVEGDVRYASVQELDRAQDATVGGTVTQVDRAVATPGFAERLEQLLLPFLAVLFAALLAFLLMPRRLLATVQASTQGMGLAFVIGFSVLLLGPFVVVLFFATGLGIVVGALLLALYALLLLISIIVSGPVLGALCSRAFLQRETVDIITVALGVTALFALLLVPIVGLSLYVALVALVLGTVVRTLYRGRR